MKKRVVLLLLSCLGNVSSYAEDPTPVNTTNINVSTEKLDTTPLGENSSPNLRYLTYPEAAQFALNENYDLRSIREQSEAYRFRSKQALSPNNPYFFIYKNDVTGMKPFSVAASDVYQIQYTLGFPGKAFAVSAANLHQSEALREQALAKEIDILTQLSNNYVALVMNRRIGDFLKEEEKKAKNLLKLLEKKFASAQAGKVDLLNITVVISRFHQDLLINKNEKQKLLTQFLNIIRKPGSRDFLPVIAMDIAEPKIELEVETLTDMMKKNRPNLLAAKKQVEVAQSNLKNAMLSPFPDFQLISQVNNYNVPSAQAITGVSRDYSFGIGISVPIFLPFNELNGIQAARRDNNVAVSQEKYQKLQAQADLQTLIINFQSLDREIENLKNVVVPAAKTIYDLVSLNYSLGKVDYFRLNDARSTWVQVRVESTNKRLIRAQVYNAIIQQVGCDFNKKGGPHDCR
jgi:outer membrane protein TolC